MEGNYKIITIHGKLKENEPLTINWFENDIKYIGHKDFMFHLNSDDFFEKYKQIQDTNDLEFLKITKIEEIKPEENYEELW